MTPSVCGDGVWDTETEECDPNDPESSSTCDDQCLRDWLVFATSEEYVGGDLGGVAGADLKCNQLALLAGLISPEDVTKSRMRAWLSGVTYDAATRVKYGRGRYVLPGEPRAVVVDRFEDLLLGALKHPISRDETGAPLEWGYAWTNTDGDGTAIGFDSLESCDEWTGYEDWEESYVGDCLATDLTWTVVSGPLNPTHCSADYHLYCFEVFGVWR